MANYYTKLSFVVELPAEATQYVIALAQTVDDLAWNDVPADYGLSPEDRSLVGRIADASGHTGCAYVEQDGALWFRSEESASVESLAGVIQAALSKFDIDEAVTIEWSNDCDKPRLDAFGGGAAIITKTHVESMTTTGWLNQRSKALGAEDLTKPPL